MLFRSLSKNLSTVRDTGITLGVILVIIWIALMITATSNGVNLTDGLDGLATGASVMTFLAFVLIGVWEFSQSCAVAVSDNCYNVRDPLDLAVLAAAFAGSCTGFLWWNASPAKIFMGDVGSTFIGSVLSGLMLQADSHRHFMTLLLISFPLLADAFFCIIRRTCNRENIFMAHRKHLFQRLKIGRAHV